MSLAYLTSQYPAISHTFIRREVAALRRLGVDVATFSVRPASSADLSGANGEEAANTFTILSQPAAAFLTSLLAALFINPAGFVRTARLALGHRPPGVRGLVLAGAHFAEAMVLARELRRRGISHLHTHFANSGATVSLLAARYLGIRWSFVMHGPSETDYPAGYLLPEKVQAADMVVCVSWFGHSQAMRLVTPDHWAKFRLVHCGLALEDLTALPTDQRDADTIICVGRLCSDKAQAGLLKAFALVSPKFPTIRLRLVGDGPDRAILEQLTRDLGIASTVTFLGRLPEVETLREISRSGLMVLPSFWEGLPVVLMEAMALGVPVISSRVAGIPELIDHDRNGLLFTPAKWSDLANAIARLLEDRALGQRLSVAGRETIVEKFRVDQSAMLLKDYFSKLPGMTGEYKPSFALAEPDVS